MITGHLIRQARRRSGLTQEDLATRVATTQSAVARWEAGGSTPSLETLRRVVEACGFELRYAIIERDTSEWSLAQRNLALTHEQRLDQLAHTVAFARAGRDAMAAHTASPIDETMPTAPTPSLAGDTAADA
jgi:transcriptional regulator with XRE-family HTH domain